MDYDQVQVQRLRGHEEPDRAVQRGAQPRSCAHNICVLVKSMYELGIEPEFRSWVSEIEDRGLALGA